MTRVLSEVQANHCPAELVERKDVSANLAILRFRVAERPSFTAGQYATIGIAIDGDVVERPYSIVSSPHEPFLEFFIELVPGGSITPKLWELKVGCAILVRRRIVGQFFHTSSTCNTDLPSGPAKIFVGNRVTLHGSCVSSIVEFTAPLAQEW
jgi:ferredoxin-NADP reductase